MKKFLWITGILIALLIVAALVAPSFISQEDVKARIVTAIEEKTGHKIAIGGNLRVKFFPVAGVDVENVTFFGTLGEKTPLMQVKAMNVNVAVIPLISSRVEIQSLSFDSPQIYLHVNKARKANWEVTAAAPKEEAPKIRTGLPAPKVPPQLKNLVLGNVSLKNGAVTYNDESTGKAWEIEKIELSLAMKNIAAPLTVDGKATWGNRTIAFDAQVEALQSLLADERTKLAANIKSDLLSASIDGTVERKVFTGNVQAKTPSLPHLQAAISNIKAVAEGTKALPVSFSGAAKCDSVNCALADVKLSAGALSATGSIKSQLAPGQLPYVELKLVTDVLDLNEFLPSEIKTGSAIGIVSEAHAAEGTGWSHEKLDLSALRGFNATAAIDAGGVKIQNIKIGKSMFRAKVERGRFSTDISSSEIYGGQGSVTINIEAASQGNTLEKRVQLRGIKMEPFLKDATGDDRLSGTADIASSVIGSGASQHDIVSSLRGQGSIKILDGSIKGFDIAGMVRNIQSAFKNVDTSSQKTDFAELSGTFTIANGIAHNDDLAMKAPLMRLSGAGDINIVDKTIRYRLLPQVVQTIQGQGGKEKEGLGVPVIVEGSLDNPTFRLDLESAVREAIKNPEKLKEQLKDGKGAIKNLKGLLKGL